VAVLLEVDADDSAELLVDVDAIVLSDVHLDTDALLVEVLLELVEVEELVVEAVLLVLLVESEDVLEVESDVNDVVVSGSETESAGAVETTVLTAVVVDSEVRVTVSPATVVVSPSAVTVLASGQLHDGTNPGVIVTCSTTTHSPSEHPPSSLSLFAPHAAAMLALAVAIALLTRLDMDVRSTVASDDDTAAILVLSADATEDRSEESVD
jgi:hypothetical protein